MSLIIFFAGILSVGGACSCEGEIFWRGERGGGASLGEEMVGGVCCSLKEVREPDRDPDADEREVFYKKIPNLSATPTCRQARD